MIAPLYMVGDGGTCPKCGTYSGVDATIQYMPPEHDFDGLFAPEHIRVHCPTCGFSERHPCADAAVSRVSI